MTGTIPHQQQPVQQPQQVSQQQKEGNEQTTTEAVQEKFKGFLKQAKENLPTPTKKPSGPNLGFKPTAAMAQRHEDALVSGKRPLYQFQVRSNAQIFKCSVYLQSTQVIKD